MQDISRTPSLDVPFLTRWSPARIMATGIIFYAVAIIVSPLQYDFDVISWGGVVYAVAAIAAFFMGCYIGQTVNARGEPATPQPFQVPLDRYVNITIVIAGLSIAARFYDRFVVRNFSVQETYAETRESIEASVSVWGYLGGPGFSLGLTALALIWLSSSQRRRPVVFVLACLIAAYPMLEVMIQASRSTMLSTAFLVFFFARATGALPWLVKSKLAMSIVALGLVAVFQIIFEIRSLESGGYEESISEVYRLSAPAQFAAAPTWLTNIIVETDGWGLIAGALKTWVHFEQYLTHSWLVYFFNFDQFQDGVWGWGRFHLNMPLRLANLLVEAELTYSPYEHGMSEGLFSTVFSSIYYDFGALGPLLAGLFGFMVTVLQKMTIRLPARWLSLYALLCYAIAMTLIDNLLIGGIGAFAIWGNLLYVGIHMLVSSLSRRSFLPASPGLAPEDGPAPGTAD